VRTSLLVAALAFGASRPSATAATPPPRIPIATFAALPQMEQPTLSPDGRRIAAKSTADRKTKVIIIGADHPEAEPKAIDFGSLNVTDMNWAGDQRLLVQVADKGFRQNGAEFTFLRLVAIDTETAAVRLLDRNSNGSYAGDVLYTDPSGTWALVASQDDKFSYPSVKRVDLETGAAKIVESAKDGVWDWYADDRGIVRAAIAYDDHGWTLWYRAHPGEAFTKSHGKFPKDDSVVDRFIFHGDKSWIVTNERTGRFALYRFDPATQTVGEPIFEHPDVDIDDILYDPWSGDVSAVEFQDDRTQIHWVDRRMASLQAKLDQALPNSANITTGWSRDEKRVLVKAESASDPGLYYLLDRSTSQMHPVINPRPEIDPRQLAPVKPIRYQTRDGLTLRAYLTLPVGREAKRLPLILLPHGGPFARDEWGYDPFVQFFANRGYAVLQPEFRGSTGFGKDFVEKGFGEIGKKMQDDLDDGVNWLVQSGQVDPKRVCIVGMSYGGYAALWGAIRNPERYRCAASWAGPTDMPAMMRYDRRQFSASRYFREFRKRYPENEDLATVSPISFAERIKIPVLIGQGEKDETVPVSQGKRMVDALTKAGANVTSAFYKDSKHDFGSSKDLADWLARLEAFLSKYNPA
jgi:dipeptidyl aminopeptidase/acylaminoacyl peptidase